MSRFVASFPSLAQPRVAAVALIGLALAGCSNSSRFDTPYASNTRAPAPQQQRPEYTGSIAQRPAPAPVQTSRIVSQPLPQPSAPQTVQASNNYPVSQQGAYRPSAQPQYQNDVTGSVAAKSTGGWTWDGGTPVTVGQGESIDTIARVNRVPVQALMQTNGITNASQIRPGQRLVIPRYVASGAPQVAAAPQMSAPQMAAPAHTSGNVHVVGPGESLMSISRRNAVPLSTLARANNIQPHTQLKIGDRITIPGGRQAAVAPQRPAQAAPQTTMAAPAMAMAQPAPQIAAPQVAQPRAIPMDKTAALAPTQTARMATQEPVTTETAASGAEAAGAVPSFRWPVHGRVIAGFGSKPNGVQNDGINLAVPEGTPVKAAEDGVVAYAGNELKGYGNLVLIRHANGFVSAYANARDLLVKRGDNIKRGQVIANAGQTGNVTSPQLHFEIRKGSTPVDPTKYLSGT